MKPTMNWQVWCNPFGLDYYRCDRGWKIFEFGCIKLIEMPEQGQSIASYQYKGFIIRFAYWLPFDRV
jgi:hypothetical protein